MSNSHVEWRPSAELITYFEAPCITLHTGNRAAETTGRKPRRLLRKIFIFCPPPPPPPLERFIAVLQQALWYYTYPLHSPFSSFQLWNHLPSPLLSVLSIISDHSAEVIVMETLIKQVAH